MKGMIFILIDFFFFSLSFDGRMVSFCCSILM